MDSAGHRANIMGKTWDVIGIGAYKGPTGKKMWTVLFADKCGSTAPKPTPKPTPAGRPHGRRPGRPRSPPPKATPRPTPKPAAAATLDPGADARARARVHGVAAGDNLIFPGAAAGPSDAAPSEPTSTPPGDLEQEVGLRVVDRQSTDGLLGTIVGGVAGFFFGGG